MSYTELEQGYQGLRKATRPTQFYVGDGDLELCDASEGSLGGPDSDMDAANGKQVVVGVCAMAKKSQSKPMKEILTRLQEFEYIKVVVFPEDIILNKPVEEWPVCDCLISFHSKGFPLDKAIQYSQKHNPYVINNLHMQYDIQDRRKVYSILKAEGIEIPRYAVLDRDSPDPKHHELVESEDHVEVNGITFNKPFVEKPVSAEDHNIYIYYPTSAGGGSQRLFRKIGSRSSVYSPESRVRKTGSYIYEDFMPTDGTDVKVYTVGPDYAHAEARKSPALDGKVERDREGKEIRYPVILSNAEKLISRKVCLAFKQAVCGFDLLRANGKSFVCDVNGFSFVKNSNKYYDDCAKILGNMILRELAPTLHIPWSVPFQLDDPPIVPTTFGKMMELRCVVGIIRHGDRTPKQKMKVEVRHPKFFEIFEKYDGYKQGHVKLKRPKQLQEILDIARSLLAEIQQHEADPEIEEKQGKLEQLKTVLEMYGHFSGINRKVQMKYQPKGRPRGSSSDDVDKPAEPSLVLILKWGGELTPAGRIQAEELGRIFRCMYPGGQGRHLAGEYAGAQGLGLLRLHSTFRHDLKIYASDEGRVQMTAAAFAKGLLALEGELTPILVQMVKSANTNGLLDNDCDSSKYQNMCKSKLHELMQVDREFSDEDRENINPGNSSSISDALDFVKNPFKCCLHVHELIKNLMEIVKQKKEDPKTKDAILYHGETWELMGRRWGKIEKDFYTKNKNFDISKIPDIYDCIKYDLQHNQHTLQFEQAEELYINAKYLADIVIPQEYGLTVQEKLTIGQGICTPLLKKIRADLQRNIEESGDETVNRLNPRYSHGVSSPGRHVRTRLYFTSESHIHSLITVLRHGGLLDIRKDEQWRRAMEYVSMVSELNYMSQVVVMLYEDPTKDPCSEERFHVELHFSPGVNCCVQKNLPPGPGFRPHSRNESAASKNTSTNTSATATPEESKSRCSLRIDEEETIDEDTHNNHVINPPALIESPPSTNGLSPLYSPDQDTTDYYSTFIAASDPIPIRNSHTVCGNEAMHLAKRLNEELANQSKSGGRSFSGTRIGSPDPEPRSRSYDHKSPSNKGSKADQLQYQSLDAVNNQGLLNCKEIEAEEGVVEKYVDEGISSGNVPHSPPVPIPTRLIANSDPLLEEYLFAPKTNSRFLTHHAVLSPISGSFDCDLNEFDSEGLRKRGKSPTNECPLNKLRFECDPEIKDTKSENSTNELPLTELNLALFTSKQTSVKNATHNCKNRKTSNCNLLNLNQESDLNDNSSLEVNCESENSDESNSSNCKPESKKIQVKKDKHQINDDARHKREKWPQCRSFSEPNILETDKYRNKIFMKKDIFSPDFLSPVEVPIIPFSFYPPEMQIENPNTPQYIQQAPLQYSYYKRNPTNLLSFFTSSETSESPSNASSLRTPSRSLSHPAPDTADDSLPLSGTEAVGISCTGGVVRRHRHSIAGQMSYYKMLHGFGGMMGSIGPWKKNLGAGSANSLFSTAVISGSSSAPNLRDMIPNTASVSVIEGYGGVPAIRPLETLHNALSLKQLDTFLEHMTAVPLFRTPSSTPPKHPSTPLPSASQHGSTASSITSEHPQPLKLQSPSSSWSGPPSFISSSGPSSPGLSEPYSGMSKESSDMSSSVISADGVNMGNLSHMFLTAPDLDQDLGNVGILLETSNQDECVSQDPVEFPSYFVNLRPQARSESGEVTPVSGGSEIEFNTTEATVGSTADCDITVTEDIEGSLTMAEDEDFISLNSQGSVHQPVIPQVVHPSHSDNMNKSILPTTTNQYIHSPKVTYGFDLNKHERLEECRVKLELLCTSKNLGSDKWAQSKEKFLDNSSHSSSNNSVNLDKEACHPGTVLVKESFIEPPRISRVSRSFHGNTPKNSLDLNAIPRRASDSPISASNVDEHKYFGGTSTLRRFSEIEKPKKSRPPYVSQISQPTETSWDSNSTSSSSDQLKVSRFKTIFVDESEMNSSKLSYS